MKSIEYTIVSVTGDVHAYALNWALNEAGHHSQLLEGPLGRRGAWMVPAAAPASASDTETLVIFRRSAPASLIKPVDASTTALLDAANAEESNIRLEQDLESLLALRFGALNRPADTRIAGGKLLQMHAAARAGLRVPEALVTDEASQAAEFARRHGGSVVYKPYRHNVWQVEPGKFATSRTRIVTSETLDDAVLSTPGIFQTLIEKKAEHRVCVFNDALISVRQTPPADDGARPVDWRREARRQDTLKRSDLPAPVRAALFRLLASLNIQMATIDLAEDSQGRLWFLDLNPSGQFLYLEAINPDLPMLRTWVQGVTRTPAHQCAAWPELTYERFTREGLPAHREACQSSDALLPLRIRKTYALTDLAEP